MEILETNLETFEKTEHPWDSWLQFDNKPRIIERGIDYTEESNTIKRHLQTEAARRDLDITTKVLTGERVLYQVFDPSGKLPKLPELPDARKKYDWDLWLNGEVHYLEPGKDFETDYITMRAYAYKVAAQRGIKVTVSLLASKSLAVQAYSPTNEKVADV